MRFDSKRKVRGDTLCREPSVRAAGIEAAKKRYKQMIMQAAKDVVEGQWKGEKCYGE